MLLSNWDSGKVLASGTYERGLYRLDLQNSALFAVSKSRPPRGSFALWHSRLGHVHNSIISVLRKNGFLHTSSIFPSPTLCSSCQLAKSPRLSFAPNDKRSLHVLDLIHCDLWGPAPVISASGFRYYAVFIDDFSRFVWFYPMTAKSEFYDVFVRFKSFVETQFSRKIKTFQSDGGTEFTNHKLQSMFISAGIRHIMSCPYTPAQNGRAERKHRHITETGLTMLFHSSVPLSYWVEAFSAAVYVINRLPSAVLNHASPFELLYGSAPGYDCFRIFGCRVFPCLRDYAPHKLSPRSVPCVFLGYSSTHKGYRCLDLSSGRTYITRNARFDETCFPFANSPVSRPYGELEITSFRDPASATIVPTIIPETSVVAPPTQTPSHCRVCDPAPQTPPPPVHDPAPPAAPPNMPSGHPQSASPQQAPNAERTHPMGTRSQSGIFKPRYPADIALIQSNPLYCALAAASEPKGVKTAMKYPHWVQVMNEEMDALRTNHTWDLVPRPSSINVVGSKWVYRTKLLADGSLDRYKACLVAQGFTQLPGFDFTHTFSPVVKASTVRIVLALAVMNAWPLHQLDVKNAFLNGYLSKLIYMEQPPGFTDPLHPNYVCRLKKALYGLRQAPLACKGSVLLYLLVYVDDIVLTGNSSTALTSLLSRIRSEFSIKDMGRLGYFLGLEVSHSTTGLFLSQSKYARDILTRADLLESKPVSTPLAPNISFRADGTPYSDPTTYRSLVGTLQYLTITRPDLAYAVNTVSQFQQVPTLDHFQAVKRILRYVNGTLDFGISFNKGLSSLLGYSDADWARCLDTRRSTYGYSIFLGGNLVSWSAKKQPTVSRSSCESEYRAMANTASEILWITHLLRELHALPPQPPILLCDNRSALFLTQNPVSHKRAKHIDIDYHFVRELVESGRLKTQFVASSLQLADIFTKSLPRSSFEFIRSKLRVGRNPSLRLRGDVRVEDM